MAVERSELQLVWPPDTFAAEGRALLDEGRDSLEDVGWLLAEAFHGERGYRLYDELDRNSPSRWFYDGDDPWAKTAPQAGPRPTETLLRSLVEEAPTLPRYVPRRYYRARTAPAEPVVLTFPQLKSSFARCVVELSDTGYFVDAFGSTCVDARQDPDAEGQRQLAALLQTNERLWPLGSGFMPCEEDWPEELFYDVVEALHDLITRPRRRTWHSHGDEWDYDDFARRPGQAIYRWRMNELLARSEVNLRLAESGPDAGLLVRSAGDPRDALVEQMLQAPASPEQAEIEHAIELFRSRQAGREEKRSAVITLVRLLEARRSLIKHEFLSKDEDALFQIANQFDLRHGGAKQRSNYDDAYLDWLFWWYLATVELTDRLMARAQQE